ncbi:TrkA domain protein [hydrothermal vent metagenome]|uniref:TrkA domain protein n=1 Tax=hydrothermal vent metagenome TaxID=652676 RepID=A0A1W1C845_9ZZZZ
MASGSVARNFITAISKNRVAENHYYVTCHKIETLPKKVGKNVTLIDEDPTSYSKLSKILNNTIFSDIFIVMEDIEDVEYVLKNIVLSKTKVRIALLHQWDEIEINLGLAKENCTIIHSDALLASHLYNQLPNVPLIAQNIGLGEGEIMEVHVPLDSAYAYRHVGSILQRKWKIIAIYRNSKQILPSTATMIRPNDNLLIIGKPMVLDGVYRTINKRMGLFPEPFGKDMYLLVDFRHDKDNVLRYLEEALYILNKLKNKNLFVRVIYPNDFGILEALKSSETLNKNVTIAVSYANENLTDLIEFDINEYEIGLIMITIPTFTADNLQDTLYNLKKLVYVFGKESITKSRASMVLMDEQKRMESISATAFDISEKLGLSLHLCDFDPEGDFESKKMTVEHYETLSQILNKDIKITKKVTNPIRELSRMNHFLQVTPFEKSLNTQNMKKIFSIDPNDFILTQNNHPKLLVPFVDLLI